MSLEQAHFMSQDNAILSLQQRVRQSSRQLEQMTAQFTTLQGCQRAPEPNGHGDEDDYSSVQVWGAIQEWEVGDLLMTNLEISKLIPRSSMAT